MKIKVIYSTEAEIEVSDIYEGVITLFDKHEEESLNNPDYNGSIYMVWRELVNKLDAELKQRLPKCEVVQKALYNDILMYED